MEFRFWLREFMEREGLTQESLGKKIDVSQVTVGQWLRGENRPRPDILIRLAEESKESPIVLFNVVYNLPLPSGEEAVTLKHPLMREIMHEIQGLDDVGLRLIRDAIRWIFSNHGDRHFIERRDPSRSRPELGRRATDKSG